MKTTATLLLLLAACSSAHPVTDAGMLPPDSAIIDADGAIIDSAAAPDTGVPDASLDVCVLLGAPDDLEIACSAWDNAAIRSLTLCGNALPCPWTAAPPHDYRVACVTLLGDANTCDDVIAAVDACQCL